LDYQFGYPMLINDHDMVRLVKGAIIEIVGFECYVKNIQSRIISEDMAFFHQKVPGCYFYLGAAHVEKGLNIPSPNTRSDFDEAAVVLEAQTMFRVA